MDYALAQLNLAVMKYPLESGEMHDFTANLERINQLAERLGVEPKMELLPMQPGDVQATYASIDRAQAKLGFSPTTPISAGLPQFTAWYQDYHQG